MNSDLHDVIIRLQATTRQVADTIPDDPPTWNPRPSALPLPRHRNRAVRPAAVAAIAAAAAVLLIRIESSGPQPQTLPQQLVAAVERTAAAHTARITITAAPLGGQGQTAVGVIDFDRRAARARYPSGFTMIYIGDSGWTTTWPPDPSRPTWEAIPADPAPTTPAGRLRHALRPNTTLDALLVALRRGIDQVTSPEAGRYHAVIGTTWTVDVWAEEGFVTRITVTSPTGTSTIEYSDPGVSADIEAPPNN